jgi:carbamoyltransferase
LLKENIFENIWVQPASGDAGGALGAALSVWHLHENGNRKISKNLDSMKGSYLGPKYNDKQIKSELDLYRAKYKKLNEDDLIEVVATSLANGKAVGWMQGRMEFGPRSLGARSILADPRSAIMQKQLNLKVKYRESFRPFAPSTLQEDVTNWFEIKNDSPYMLFVADVKKSLQKEMTEEEELLFGIQKLNIPRSSVPAITHVDYSARIQTVHASTNPKFHKLISKFKDKTECPILVNTSFNIRGEPIVCSPKDAFKCFMGTDLDILVLEDYILFKTEQDKTLLKNYKNSYELD